MYKMTTPENKTGRKLSKTETTHNKLAIDGDYTLEEIEKAVDVLNRAISCADGGCAMCMIGDHDKCPILVLRDLVQELKTVRPRTKTIYHK